MDMVPKGRLSVSEEGGRAPIKGTSRLARANHHPTRPAARKSMRTPSSVDMADGAPNPVAMPRDENLARTTRSLGVSADFMRSVQQVCADQQFEPSASLDVHHARRARLVSSRKTKLTSSFLSPDRVSVDPVDSKGECVVHPPLPARTQ